MQELDPDILLGWDVQMSSLGYLQDRAVQLGEREPLLRRLSRTPDLAGVKEKQDDEWGRLHASGVHCTGERVALARAGGALMLCFDAWRWATQAGSVARMPRR